jgi:hypothetical protein
MVLMVRQGRLNHDGQQDVCMMETFDFSLGFLDGSASWAAFNVDRAGRVRVAVSARRMGLEIQGSSKGCPFHLFTPRFNVLYVASLALGERGRGRVNRVIVIQLAFKNTTGV